jgi:hypothetical protein
MEEQVCWVAFVVEDVPHHWVDTWAALQELRKSHTVLLHYPVLLHVPDDPH